MSSFPDNIVDAIATHIPKYFEAPSGDPADPEWYQFVKRPIMPMDAARCISVFPAGWAPEPRSELIGQLEDGMGRYAIRSELLVKHANLDGAWPVVSRDAKLLRVVLYRDEDLWTAMRQMTETIAGTVERFKDFKVTGQQYLPSNAGGQNMIVAVTNMEVKVETTKLA